MAAVLVIFNSVLSILNKLQDLRDSYTDAYRMFSGINGSLTVMMEFMASRIGEHNDIPPKMLSHISETLAAVQDAVSDVARMYNATFCGIPYGATLIFGGAYFGTYGSRRVLRTLSALDADLSADIRFLQLYMSANTAVCLSQLSKQNVLVSLKDKRARDFWSMHMDSDDRVDAAALLQALAHAMPDRTLDVLRYVVSGVTDSLDQVFVDTFGRALGEAGIGEWVDAAERGPAITCFSPAHTAAVNAAVVRGDLLATASADRTVKLFSLAPDGAPALKHVFIGHSGPVSAVAITPDRRRVVSACGSALFVWNTARRERERALLTPSAVQSISVSDDRILFTTGRRGGDVTVVSALTGETLCEFIPHAAGAAACVLLEGGRRVMTWGQDGSVAEWDADSGSRLRHCKKPAFAKHVPVAAWPLPSGAVAAVTQDGAVGRWDATGAQPRFAAQSAVRQQHAASGFAPRTNVCQCRGGQDVVCVTRTTDSSDLYFVELRRPGDKARHRFATSARAGAVCAAADEAADVLYLGHDDGSLTWHAAASGVAVGELSASRRELLLQPRHRSYTSAAAPLLARSAGAGQDGVVAASFRHSTKVLLLRGAEGGSHRALVAPAGYAVGALAGGGGLLAVALETADGRPPACMVIDPSAPEDAAPVVHAIDALSRSDHVLALAFNPASGSFVALCDCGPLVKVLQSDADLRAWTVLHEDAASQAPRGVFAVAGCILCPCDKGILVLRNSQRALVPTPDAAPVTSACSIDARSGRVLTVHSNSEVRVWPDTAFGCSELLFTSDRPVHAVASDGAGRLFFAGTDGCILARGDRLDSHTHLVATNAGGAVAIALDAGHIVTFGCDGLLARHPVGGVKP